MGQGMLVADNWIGGAVTFSILHNIHYAGYEDPDTRSPQTPACPVLERFPTSRSRLVHQWLAPPVDALKSEAYRYLP